MNEWVIELFNDTRPDGNFRKALHQFNYSTISDVIFHVRYNAEENVRLKTDVLRHLKIYFEGTNSEPTPSFKIFDIKPDSTSEWHRFLHPDTPEDRDVIVSKIAKDLFWYRDKSEEQAIGKITLIADSSETGTYEISIITPAGSVNRLFLASGSYGNLLQIAKQIQQILQLG